MSDWISLPLSDLPIASGKSINPFEFPDEEFELYSVPSHETGRPEFVKGGDIGSNKQLVSPGTVLLCKINPRINRTWIVGEAGSRRQIASTEWIAFDSCEEVDQRFLMFFMQQSNVRDYLAANASGVGGSLMRIKPATLKGVTFQMPDIQTQRKIVEKLEELLSDLDAGVAELKAAQRKLAQYRQSLLKAAVEGALTADWRATRGKSQKAGAELLGWALVSVGQAGDVQLGRQRAPQFHSGDNMVPYLRVANVFENRIDISDVKEMHFSLGEEERFQLRSGDILLNEGQSLELVGRPAIYRDELPRACFTNTLVRFRAKPGLLPEYALSVFLHYMHSGRFQRIAKITTNIAHLGAGRFAELEFPLPPLEEQTEIVATLETQLDAVRQQQAAIERGLQQAAAQRKNLLKTAFAGQLVPQDPNEEPASELLARIRAAREAVGDKTTTSKRGRKAK